MEIRFSYDHKFDSLINRIKLKYGENILRFSGVHPEQLDIADFTRSFLFGDSMMSVADKSVDSNANVDDRSVVAFDHELAKSENKLNALNMIWTYIIKNMTETGEPKSALKVANDAIENIINCALYLNDSHFAHKSYSYYEHTPITTRINGVVRQMTLKQLFDMYSNYSHVNDDCEQVDLKDMFIPVNLDLAHTQMNKNSRRTIRFKKSGFGDSHHPRERHTIEVWDDTKFVDVTRVLRHKRHNRLVEISLESGHFMLVSEDHPIILEDGSEIEAGKLEIGMDLARSERYKGWKYKHQVTNELAYTLGFVAGDGNVPMHRFYDEANSLSEFDLAVRYDEIRNQFYAYQKDIENSKIYNCIKSLGITNKVTVHKNGKVLSFCSLQLSHCCAKVFGLNEGNSSFSKYVPRNIMEWNREAQISYLAGIVDAEGSMMLNGKTCSIRMTSLSMINQLHELCDHLGIRSRLGVAEEGLYRVYLRVTPELRQSSVKCLPFDNLEVAAAYDVSSDLPKVKKLRFIEDGIPDQSGRDHYEWVYDITTSSGTFSSCGFKAHNCYSFDLTPLVYEGMPFVKKVKIGPPKHYSSMINLVVQSTAFISNQIAGAASYPNLFVYLDYFARKDFGPEYWNSPYRDQVEQGFQNLVYSLNYPFRGSQCVDEDTEVLTPDGFKKYDELLVGDHIYTWNNGSLNIQNVKAVNIYDYDGVMHSYRGRDYHQFVSPQHRILRKVHNGTKYELVRSEDAISLKSPIDFPVAMLDDNRPDFPLSDELIELAVFILTDGSIDKQVNKQTRVKWFKSPRRWGNERFVELMCHFGIPYSLYNKDGWKDKDPDLYPEVYPVNCYNIPSTHAGIILDLLDNESKESLPYWCTKLSRRQAQLFIETWASLDGNIDENAYDRMKLQCDNYIIADQLQHVCFLSGKGSQIQTRMIGNNAKETIYVRPYNRLNKSATVKEAVHYKGKIWCPTTEDGVVVFRKDGRIFISGNSAFSTLSIYDRVFMETLFENIVYPDGSKADLDSIDYLQKWYFRWFNEESKKQVFTFPVTTANISCEDGIIHDEGFLDYVAAADREMGLLNIYSGPPNALSNCCRLRSKIIKEHTNSLGTGSVSIGSHRVCTINLPRIAIEADGDRVRFMEILKTRLYLTNAILHAHRRIIEDLIKLERLPLYTHGWMHLSKQYSTVGLIGPYEACKFMGMDITKENGKDFITVIMDYINAACLDEESLWKDGRRFNLELIPGEQVAVKVCEADKMIYASFPNPYKLYSNQFIPLIDKSDIATRIQLQGHFDSRAQGGCIMHLNIDHQLTHDEQVKKLIRACVKSGAMYYAINYNIAVCAKAHQSIGKIKTCPVCGEKIDTNKTRVVGFITDESEWHKVRRWEYGKRQFYDEEDVDESPMSMIENLELAMTAV